MDIIPITWLLDELRSRGLTDLVDEYHARQRIYQKMLTKRQRDEMRLSVEELKARRDGSGKE